GTVLGESEKRVRHLSETCFNYEFSCSFQCARDPQAIAELARKLVTVLDFLPEEKKADTRTVVLGQAVLDFLPLLHGENIYIFVWGGGTSGTDILLSACFSVHVSEALVSADALSFCNLLRVTVETAFSVPESWTLPSGSSPTASSYTAALEVPLTAEVTFKNTIISMMHIFKVLYECSLSFHPPPENPHLVLLRLGDICQQEGQFEQAKLVHLQACEQSPSCLTWLGLGAACYRLGELSLAETALTEANHLNNRNAQVWAYLSFICLKSGRLKEAEQFYKYAVQVSLKSKVHYNTFYIHCIYVVLQFKLQNEELIREYTQMFDQARFSYLDHCFEGAAS
uniref:Uncharacterized protein n=1 Tax=Periophthalmus magnuspinnatus TaxID=409849 RepID=A0A3B4BBC9_9GOBI